MSTIPAGVFKAKCLELMDEVERTKKEVVVTKYGKPVAKLVPVQGGPTKPLFGRAKGTVVTISEDAFAPEPELWDALNDH
jgi:prevent-host-death family protein